MSKRKPFWRQWRNDRANQLAMHLANVTKTTQYILNDLAALPWGVKPRLYALKGDPMDLTAELVGTMPSMDPMCFVNAYDDGWRVPEDTEGLIFVFETVRHYEFKEILETPEAEQVLRETFKSQYPNVKRTRQRYEEFYVKEVVPSLPPATLVPAHMRKRMRVGLTLLKNGFGTLAYRTEGKEDLFAFSFDETKIGDMANSGALYQLLHNIRPEQDAVTNVQNFKILQEIEALG